MRLHTTMMALGAQHLSEGGEVAHHHEGPKGPASEGGRSGRTPP